MKRFLLVLGAIAFPVALFAQAAHAGTWDGETAVLKKLHLSGSQISQVLDLQKTQRTQARQTLAHVRVLKAEIQEALTADTVDTSNVDNLIDQAAQSLGQLAKNHIATMVQLKKIMGDDAYAEYRTLMDERIRHQVAYRFRAHHRRSPQDGWGMGGEGLSLW